MAEGSSRKVEPTNLAQGPHITPVLSLKTEQLVREALEFINIIQPFSPTWGPNAV